MPIGIHRKGDRDSRWCTHSLNALYTKLLKTELMIFSEIMNPKSHDPSSKTRQAGKNCRGVEQNHDDMKVAKGTDRGYAVSTFPNGEYSGV